MKALVIADGRAEDVRLSGRLTELTMIEIGAQKDLRSDEVPSAVERE
jgi:hypothetical protein